MMKTNKFFFEYAFVCLWIIFVIYDLLLEYSSFIAAMVFFILSVWLFFKKYYAGLYDFGFQEYNDGFKRGIKALMREMKKEFPELKNYSITEKKDD